MQKDRKAHFARIKNIQKLVKITPLDSACETSKAAKILQKMASILQPKWSERY